MEFQIHDLDSAPEASKPLLQDSLAKYKFVPNLHGVMAESPVLLEAYKVIGDLYAKTDLSVLERQIVLLAINYTNECHYCMAAHSGIATLEKMPDDMLSALREGRPLADVKLEALRSFAVHVAVTRGWVEPGPTEALLAAGYTRRTLQEILVALSYKVMSNYMNHIAETPVDAGFQKFAWRKPA